jgi:phosphotransferase system, enzyme I, PtsP
MRGALVGPRLLLRRIREAMAEPVNAQVRLDKIVVHIAANMVAEVCSVYVLRSDGRLELFATEGLKREAVHLTTMRAGEGLVGLIAQNAEPLALSDAQSHPAFSYKPETGEEIFHSFLGVPILRGGNTLGVLVVQNKVLRTYSEEEVEALQTTAMLLAEMIASGELQSIVSTDIKIGITGPRSLKGTAIADGVGLGYAVLHEPRITIKHIVAEDIAHETKRLDDAIESVRMTIDRLIDSSDHAGTGEHRDILETFRMFAHDRGWMRRLREALATGLTAEAAVERVQNDARAKLQRSTDPYLRERLHDLDDLANRLLHELMGENFITQSAELPDNAIIIARSMGPAALLDYDRRKLRGLILEDGGPSSHVSIVARALGIPCVGDVANVTDYVEQNDAVIIDGGSGEVHIRPLADMETAYGEKARLRARRQEQYQKLRDVPTRTLDGVDITLNMNAGLLIDLPHVHEAGAQSIGLFRTELQFMVAPHFPRMDQQLSFYKTIIDTCTTPVTFRTLDIGGDKILPYLKMSEEENPALGWRAIRIGIDRPALLRLQLRALLRASGTRPMRIMFPMIAHVEEFDLARSYLDQELAFLRRHHHPVPDEIKVGAMVEVPSILWQLDELVRRVDFLSVGSNDLMQYLYAADRDNKRVAHRYDALSTPALRALKTISDAADRGNIPLTLCGEIGGRPLEAMTLLALGYRHLSMTASAIGPIKAMILALDLAKASAYVNELMAAHSSAPSLRDALRHYAETHAIPL